MQDWEGKLLMMAAIILIATIYMLIRKTITKNRFNSLPLDIQNNLERLNKIADEINLTTPKNFSQDLRINSIDYKLVYTYRTWGEATILQPSDNSQLIKSFNKNKKLKRGDTVIRVKEKLINKIHKDLNKTRR